MRKLPGAAAIPGVGLYVDPLPLGAFRGFISGGAPDILISNIQLNDGSEAPDAMRDDAAPVRARAQASAPSSAPIVVAAATVATMPGAAAGRGMPKIQTFELPIDELAHVAEGSGLHWINSDAERVAQVAEGLGGGPMLAAHAPIPGPGWMVFVERPAADAYAPLRAPVARSVVIFVLGLGLSILASVLLARRMVAPIRTLQEGAARIGAGELGHRIALRTGDELEVLGDDRGRIAIYALRSALLTMPGPRALEMLRGVPMKRVTVAKEVVRLVGELGSAEAFAFLRGLEGRPLHRDVEVARLRALWDHLERPEAFNEALTGPFAQHTGADWPHLVVLAAWGGGGAIVATRRFRWDPRLE